MNQMSLLIYLGVVITVVATAYFFVSKSLRKKEKQRIRNIKKRDIFEVVETETPVDNSEKVAIQRGVSGVETRFGNLRKITLPLILLIGGLIALLPFLSKLPGIYVSLFIGSITVILGLAAKPFIENLIAGVVISMAQPIRIGDTVTLSGYYGTVEQVNLLYTTIKVWNWRRFVIPNHILLQKEFQNHTLYDTNEWVKVSFHVAPDSDIKLVEKLAMESMTKSSHLLDVEPPAFWVMDMGKDAINCWVAGWAENPPGAWSLGDETRKNIITAFKENEIVSHKFFGAEPINSSFKGALKN